MTITHDAPVTPTTRPLSAIWVELTGKCQLECLHCYAGSGPDGTHGTMTAETWEKALADAVKLGAEFVCFIGGEPTPHQCILCMVSDGDPWNGGICHVCLPPLRPYKSRRRVFFKISVRGDCSCPPRCGCSCQSCDCCLGLTPPDAHWQGSPL